MKIPFYNLHTHQPTGNKYVEILNKNFGENIKENELFSLGIHPLSVDKKENFEKEILEIEEKLPYKNCLAIGEIGIDRRNLQSIDKQIVIFEKIHFLSEKFEKPIIIHCVRAWSDLLAIRKKLKTHKTWIFHSFNGNITVAQQLMKNNCYLSFGKALLYSEKLQETFQQIPSNYLFLETDNSPIGIEEIYKKAAFLKRKSIEELKKNIHNNFLKIFGNQWKIIG